MALKLLLVLVDTETDDPDFASPVRIFLKHLLVMSHRGLARRAPSGPEIKEPNLPIMYKFSNIIRLHLGDVGDGLVLSSNTDLDAEVNLNTLCTFFNRLEILLGGFNLLLHFRAELLGVRDSHVGLFCTSHQHGDILAVDIYSSTESMLLDLG